MQVKNRLLALAVVTGVCLLVAVAPPAEGAVDFEPAVNFAVGVTPRSVAVADFNGDGKLDLATANSGGDNVSVLLGNGNGTFGVATHFTVGKDPRSVAVADFNGDGKLDLVTANLFYSHLSVLLGNGNGTFGAVTYYLIGGGPNSVAVADFNGDGKLDLVTANLTGPNVGVLLGLGNGTFGAATYFPVGRSPEWLTVGDFNGDGKLDLATANVNINSVSVLLGNGNGTFGPPAIIPVGLEPISVAVGDFNGDGKLDLATANYGSINVSVLLGNGNGTFGAATNFSVWAGPSSVAVADFNGDGKLDLATTNNAVESVNDNVSVFLGAGNGTFGTATNFSVGLGPESVAVGDFNGDGKLDLAAANAGSNNVSVLLSGDNSAPVISCAGPDGLWHASDVSIACTAQDSGVGLADPADANFLLSTSVPSGTETSNAITGTRRVCDRNNHCATARPITGNKVDKKRPSVSCASADEHWHPGNLSVACTASDGGSGLAFAGDAGFSLLTNLPNGAESANATGATRNVCDAVSNCTLATVPGGIKVDRKAPSITITVPKATRYLPRQSVAASYSCADGGSGVILCMGPVPSGSNIDTAPPAGNKTYTVFAVDKAGNLSSQTVSYEVGGPAAPGP